MPDFKVTLVDPAGVAHLETSPVNAASATQAAYLTAQARGYTGLSEQHTSGGRIRSWMATSPDGDASKAALVVVVPLDG